MSFWVLPPEINSSRLYAGPGSAPMMSAAAAWDTLSTALYSGAGEATAAITSLDWTGPSATAMRAAWTRQQTWLHHSAAHAEHTAARARTAAAAYETARASAVHPTLIATNRTQTAALIATNLLGQNSAVIAVLEAEYAEMWAQDVAAMSTYLQTTQTVLASLAPPPSPPPLLSYLLGAQTFPQISWQIFENFGPFQAAIDLIALFTVFLGATELETGGGSLSQTLFPQTPSQAPEPAYATPLSVPLPASTPIRVSVGTAHRPAALSMPPRTWSVAPCAGAPISAARPPAQTPPRTDTTTTTPVAVPLAFPLPTGAPRAEKKEPGPETHGLLVRFVPRPPSGG